MDIGELVAEGVAGLVQGCGWMFLENLAVL